MSKTFQIHQKRLHKETDKSYTFLTSGYNGIFFTLPKSQVESFKYFEREMSKENSTMVKWISIVVSDWMWEKAELEQKLKRVSKHEIRIL